MRWILKIPTGVHKTQRIASFGFDFLDRYHNDGNEFLTDNIIRDKTWVSFVNVETKEHSKQ
jgi:hypothetical protein